MEHQTGSALTYSARFDGLRFIAVLNVLLKYFAYCVGKYFSAGFYRMNPFLY
jgi:hypothetical protein